jgi:hypothetical protein
VPVVNNNKCYCKLGFTIYRLRLQKCEEVLKMENLDLELDSKLEEILKEIDMSEVDSSVVFSRIA